jgi:hypothetical protein
MVGERTGEGFGCATGVRHRRSPLRMDRTGVQIADRLRAVTGRSERG